MLTLKSPVQGISLTFTRLHHKRQARVDAVGGLLGLLGRCHRCVSRLLDDLECVVRSGGSWWIFEFVLQIAKVCGWILACEGLIRLESSVHIT